MLNSIHFILPPSSFRVRPLTRTGSRAAARAVSIGKSKMLTIAHTLPALLSEDPLLAKYVEEAVAKTAEDISPLYRLDAFDWTVLTVYFAVLFVLSLYGAYRIKQVV